MPKVDSATFLTIGSPRIGNIDIDCALTETHTWDSIVTRVPVESGSVRSQHIVKQPYMLEVEAVISDIPIDPKKQQIALARNLAQSAVTGYAESVPGALAFKNQLYEKITGVLAKLNSAGAFGAANAVRLASGTRALWLQKNEYSAIDQLVVALSRLLELRESDVPFDYISPLGVVSNMVFTSLEIPVDQRLGKGIDDR